MEEWRLNDAVTGRSLDATADLLVQPALWRPGGSYPGHLEWRDMAVEQVTAGAKQHKILWRGNEAVGLGISQRHPELPNTVEYKNVSLEPSARGRYAGAFLVGSMVAETMQDYPGAERIVADVKTASTGMLALAHRLGFAVEAVTELESSFGHDGTPDIVLSRPVVLPGEDEVY